MKPDSRKLKATARRGLSIVVLSFGFLVSGLAAAPCLQSFEQQDSWLELRITELVNAAQVAYLNDAARGRYERVVDRIHTAIQRCGLNGDADFRRRYPEFVEYLRLLALMHDDEHQLGFEVSDEVYFAETSRFTSIPDFLVTPGFLRLTRRANTLSQAKAMLREINLHRSPAEQLFFISYQSRHLGTPDNPDSFLRLLILVPGDQSQQLPEKWVQFGIADRRSRVRNVSVVAVMPGPLQYSNVYFKDYYRTFKPDGTITIKGRWELGEGDDNCAECHKSGVLPIFPVAGSVSEAEQTSLEAINRRFRTYGPPRFDKYLNADKLGPGLGSSPANSECVACHNPRGLGSLNWPMDSKVISSFVKGGRMPLGAKLQHAERSRLYQQLIHDYFAVDADHPGILKSWLLGRLR